MRCQSETTLVMAAVGLLVITLSTSAGAQRGTAPPRPARPASAAPATAQPDGRAATARRLCGTCHPFEHVTTIRRTREQWEATVENMIGRGARGTSSEFATVIDYLSEHYGLSGTVVRGDSGPDDKPMVDPKAAEMAKLLWVSDCQACHGADARGTARGSNLVRSPIVLGDRYGSALGPYLRKDHPPAGTSKTAALTDTQVLILAHFLRDRVNDTLRGSPLFKAGNVLTGNSKAGAEYFNGEGGCATCHSPTGDLAGIATRLDPIGIQQRFLFPANAAARRRAGSAPVVTVSVTTEAGETLSGELIQIDDFNVSLRDASGTYHSVRRTAGTRVIKHDPFVAHVQLLSSITDKHIHDLVAYLETLK